MKGKWCGVCIEEGEGGGGRGNVESKNKYGQPSEHLV